MDFNAFYGKVVDALRNFVGTLIAWIDKVFWPWTNPRDDTIPWDQL